MNLDDDDEIISKVNEPTSNKKSTSSKASSHKYFSKALKDQVKFLWHQNLKVLVILAVLVFVVYANTIPNSLVSDDKGLVDPRNYSSFGKIFSDPFGALRLTFYALVHPICGDTPACYRLPSILAHFGNATLLFVLVNLLSKRRVAFFASAIFAVHPLLTETVSCISAGAYAAYTFFF